MALTKLNVLITEREIKTKNTYSQEERENEYCFITDAETSHPAHSRHMQAD